MSKRCHVAMSLTCTLFAVAAPTHASIVIYDTFLPNLGWSGGGFGVSDGPGVEIGVSFVPFSSGYLSEIWMAVSVSVTNRGGDMDVNLWADNDGRPGDLLLQIPVVDQLVYDQATPLVLEVPSNIFLSSSQQYWLTIAPYPDNWVIWHNMNLTWDELPSYLGTGIARAPDFDNGNWFVTGNPDNVFRIYAEPVSVPAPSGLLLGLLGLGALGVLRGLRPS